MFLDRLTGGSGGDKIGSRPEPPRRRGPDGQPATSSAPPETPEPRTSVLPAGQRPLRRPDWRVGSAVQSAQHTLADERPTILGDKAKEGLSSEQVPAERIPNTLAPATRALAERTLGSDGKWSEVLASMKYAIVALHNVEQQYAQTHPLPAEVVVNGEHVPVWEYIGQWVDQIGQGTILDIQPHLLNLLENPSTTTLVARIVALHAAHVFLGYTLVQQAAKDHINARPVDSVYLRSNNLPLFTQLKAIGSFIRQHTTSGELVRAFFNYNVPLLGNYNPLEEVLRAHSLR